MNIEKIKNKITKLEAEAQAILVAERPEAIQDVHKKIALYGLTDRDIQLPSHLRGIHISPKYRHPVTAKIWSGRGVQPKWIATG